MESLRRALLHTIKCKQQGIFIQHVPGAAQISPKKAELRTYGSNRLDVRCFKCILEPF